jgi:glycosyltransferase involved in cell wall biosynthesis
MKAPFVSVIIPTFNRRERCARAVRSVCNQTWTDWELIVVDDASDDGTCAEELFAGQSGNTRYLRNEMNCGVSQARNLGVCHARGEWIAFLDSDDEWHRKKLEKQVAWIRAHPQYRIVQTREIWIRNGVRVNPPKTHEKVADYIFTQSIKRCMITPSSVMIRRNFFERTGGFNESLPACEDYDLWLRITLRHPVGLVDDHLLTRYGGHNDQLSATIEVLDKYRIRALLNVLYHEGPGDDQRKLCCETVVKKARIVAAGLKKRKRIQAYEQYRNLANQFEALL